MIDSKDKKYVRFMGLKELSMYLSGKMLMSETEWNKYAYHSDSVGFCFFDDSVSPESRMEYLTGVVDMSYVAVFEPIEHVLFKESEGWYRDPDCDIPGTLYEVLFSKPKMMPVKEYSLTKYDRNTLRLVKVGVPIIKAAENSIDWDIFLVDSFLKPCMKG